MHRHFDQQIVTRCPACGHQTLFVASGGHLTCSWLDCPNPSYEEARQLADGARLHSFVKENGRLADLLNTPELHDFAKAVVLEAAHQRARWPLDHGANKTDEQWFWLIGYLAGKALHNPPHPDIAAADKRLHRIITIAAAAANWHAARLGGQPCQPAVNAAPPPAEELLRVIGILLFKWRATVAMIRGRADGARDLLMDAEANQLEACADELALRTSTIALRPVDSEVLPNGKRRYFLGPYEDGDPVALMTLGTACESLRESLASGDVDDEYTFRVVELTDAEVEALPEL